MKHITIKISAVYDQDLTLNYDTSNQIIFPYHNDETIKNKEEPLKVHFLSLWLTIYILLANDAKKHKQFQKEFSIARSKRVTPSDAYHFLRFQLKLPKNAMQSVLEKQKA